MNILGMRKLTLLDYPGKVACTIFTGGCNFRCGYCYNPSIVFDRGTPIFESEVIEYLNRNRHVLDGVCICGGEPTIHKELPGLIKRIKDETGLSIKLDTNGTNPDMFRQLIQDKLIDYIAMDIKTAPTEDRYGVVVCSSYSVKKIRESIDILLGMPAGSYEFRTTLVDNYHTEEIVEEMAQCVSGAKAWYLQKFDECCETIEMLKGHPNSHEVSKDQALKFKRILELADNHVELRGY